MKRQVADLSAANESLLDENARFRVARSSAGFEPAPRIAAQSHVTDYAPASSRAAYPYTTGAKYEPPAAGPPPAQTYNGAPGY